MLEQEQAEQGTFIAAEVKNLQRREQQQQLGEEEEEEYENVDSYLKEYNRHVDSCNPKAMLVWIDRLKSRHLLYAERHVGQVFTFGSRIERKLEMLGMIQPKYGFQFMRSSMSVIRSNSGLVARKLLSNTEDWDSSERRVIVAGKSGTGKSFILMQIAAAALMQKYIVIAVPRGLFHLSLSHKGLCTGVD
jgi:DNA replication protein DnaC